MRVSTGYGARAREIEKTLQEFADGILSQRQHVALLRGGQQLRDGGVRAHQMFYLRRTCEQLIDHVRLSDKLAALAKQGAIKATRPVQIS